MMFQGGDVTSHIQLLQSHLLTWQTHCSPATHSPSLWLTWSSSNSQPEQDSLTRELQAEQNELNVSRNVRFLFHHSVILIILCCVRLMSEYSAP